MADETLAGLPVVNDPELPPNVVELRDGFGNVIWSFRLRDDKPGPEEGDDG